MALDSHPLNVCHCSWVENFMKRMSVSLRPTNHFSLKISKHASILFYVSRVTICGSGNFLLKSPFPHVHVCMLFPPHFLGNYQKNSRVILYSSPLQHASHIVNSYLSAYKEYWCLCSVALNWTCNLFWILSLSLSFFETVLCIPSWTQTHHEPTDNLEPPWCLPPQYRDHRYS